MTFGGYLDPHPAGFVARAIARSSSGDWRDPQHVAEWVHHICRHTMVVDAVPRQRAFEPKPVGARTAAAKRR